MKAHIVGGGFGGLAAAALLIRNAHVPGEDITIYDANDRMGGGFFLGGSAESGYNLPGSIFDREYRCTFELLAAIPSASNPAISVKDEFFSFNERHPFRDRVLVIDRNGATVQHSPHFGLSLRDRFALARLALTPEAWLDGRRIEEFFAPQFFRTEFWLLCSTVLGSLPQHCAMEFRRYLNRKLGLLTGRLDMSHILQAPFNQYQAFVEPLVAWLLSRRVNLLTGTLVRDIGFAPLPGRITVNRLDYERGGVASSVAVVPEDIVLVTTGSQAADLSTGSMTEAPTPRDTRRSWALWKRLAKEHKGFGNPDVFFGDERRADLRWVTFTITTTGTEFMDQMTALTRSEPGIAGLVTLKDSSWVMSLSISHRPEILDQPQGTSVVRGYGLYPERSGNFYPKPMHQCNGEERARPISASSANMRRFRGRLGSPSNTPPAPRGRQSTPCSTAVRRHRLSTRTRRYARLFLSSGSSHPRRQPLRQLFLHTVNGCLPRPQQPSLTHRPIRSHRAS